MSAVRMVSDLTTDELVALVRKAVREELDAQKRGRALIPPPATPPDSETVAKVRRRLRRQGIAA